VSEGEGQLVDKAAEGVIAKAVKSMVRDAEDVAAKDAATDATGAAGRTAGDATHYEFNMVDNPGPLGEDGFDSHALNFAGGRYNAETLTEDTVFYRAGNADRALGQYFTRTPPEGELQSHIDNAVEWAWKDRDGNITDYGDLTHGYAVKIPKGTTVYSGPTASRGGVLVGGKEQVFIRQPWKLDGVEVLQRWPLP